MTGTEAPVALVTGAASGIGLATAQLLRERGWSLLLTDIDGGSLGIAAAELPEGSGRVEVAVADLSDPTQARDTVEQAVARFGVLNALVNSHGITRVEDNSVAETPDDLFLQILTVNLASFFATCKYALPHLIASGDGAIVNLSSAAALGAPGGPAYTASKNGIVGLTRVIARQYATATVRCNAVCPGPTDTPMYEVTRRKWGVSEYVPAPNTIPRMADAREIAEVVAFLVSPAASYVTGATYSADGGATLY